MDLRDDFIEASVFRTPLLLVSACAIAIAGGERFSFAADANTAVSIEDTDQSQAPSGWWTASMLGGAALLFAGGFVEGKHATEGCLGPPTPCTTTFPTLLGTTLGLSGIAAVGWGYLSWMQDAGSERPTALLVGVLSFSLAWTGLYALGAGSALAATDGDQQCLVRGEPCPFANDHEKAYTTTLAVGAGALVAGSLLTWWLLHDGESSRRTAARRTLSLVPGPSGATLMGRF